MQPVRAEESTINVNTALWVFESFRGLGAVFQRPVTYQTIGQPRQQTAYIDDVIHTWSNIASWHQRMSGVGRYLVCFGLTIEQQLCVGMFAGHLFVVWRRLPLHIHKCTKSDQDRHWIPPHHRIRLFQKHYKNTT